MEEKTAAAFYNVFCIFPDGAELRLVTAKTLEEAMSIVKKIKSKYPTARELRVYEVAITESPKLIYQDNSEE